MRACRVVSLAVAVALIAPAQAQAGSLRFFGTGRDDVDRVKVRVDRPARPADVGRGSFTVELWLRARARENRARAVSCAVADGWIRGNVVVDRDRYDRGRKWGISLAAGRVVWGVSGPSAAEGGAACAGTRVADGRWHHVAVQRDAAAGRLTVWVDGRLDAAAPGPSGDVSYPDGSRPGRFCGNAVCVNDPFLVLGAEKHDAGPDFPSFAGWLDEVRLSTVVRYRAPFRRPRAPFRRDAATAAIYHFDEARGRIANDATGRSDGTLRIGGPRRGPRWSSVSPFASRRRAT